jgi:hypothetical protein
LVSTIISVVEQDCDTDCGGGAVDVRCMLVAEFPAWRCGDKIVIEYHMLLELKVMEKMSNRRRYLFRNNARHGYI